MNEREADNPFERMPSVDESALVCKVGDRFVVREAMTTEEGLRVEPGAVYEAESRVYYGWNLRRVTGSGAPVLRMLNASILRYFAPQPR